jgi:hypothetical protein
MFSERWKCRFRDPNFKNFPGGMPQDPPTVAAVCSSHAWTKHNLGIYACEYKYMIVSVCVMF